MADWRNIGCAPLGNLYAPLQFAIPGKDEFPKINVDAVGALFSVLMSGK